MIETIEIIEQADKFMEVAFFSIGSDYNDGFYVGREIPNDELEKYLFPKEEVTAIVNCAFGCELYMKSMLNKGKVIKGHKLNDLFLKLDNEWRRIIIELAGYEEENVFMYFLKQSSNAFEKWRYIFEIRHEKRKIYFVFIKKLATTMKRVAYAKYYYEQKCMEKVDGEILARLKRRG